MPRLPETFAEMDRSEWTDAEVSFTLRIEKLEAEQRRILVERDRARDAFRAYRTERDLYRHHLRDALEALNQPKCSTCDGSGGVEVYAGPTPMDEKVVGWTDPEEECCDDCAGTGRDLK